jgi:threonine synthase
MGLRAGLIARWRDRLPVTAATPELTLGEGGTPLVESPTLSSELGARVFLKIEGANPTGSFKDRGMVVAIACAAERGATAVVCASTGNTAGSAAAYAARAGMKALVLHPAGAVAGPKLAQTRAVGAVVVPVDGSFDDTLRLAQEAVEHGYVVVNSGYNADRIAGQATAAYEICEQLGSAPDVLALPYGGGGNTVAFSAGFALEGAATQLVSGQAAERSTTLATAIRIGEPVHAPEVARTAATVVTVTDKQIVEAWRDLARGGIFCEPSSAAGLAALRVEPPAEGATVVCVLTGTGLKDTDAVERLTPSRDTVSATIEAVLEAAEE